MNRDKKKGLKEIVFDVMEKNQRRRTFYLHHEDDAQSRIPPAGRRPRPLCLFQTSKFGAPQCRFCYV